MDIVYSVLILTGVALLFGIAIVIANKKFAVKEDARLETLNGLLAGANCGACGKAGCADFAKALIDGEATLDDCAPTSLKNKKEIAEILGGDISLGGESVVINACVGGNASVNKYEYQGYGDCSSVELLAGGRKECPTGCIGMGKCVDVCRYHAINIVEGVAVVDQEKCTQCGACILACPKKILKRLPRNTKYFIACSSCDKGREVRAYCKNGCIACGLCAKVCPDDAIKMVENLPVFDYDKCTRCGLCEEKCPTNSIRHIEEKPI